ncbi:methyltransferase domain-containing protein [Bdellovibrionota bacterium FG-2]
MSNDGVGTILFSREAVLPHLGSLDIPFELVALAEAVNYQRWLFRTVEPFLGNRILEVGAGLGNMSQWLPIRERLILTENDPVLMEILYRSVAQSPLFGDRRLSVMPFDVLKSDKEHQELLGAKLDTVVSFNVLEHIDDDGLALERLCQLVRCSANSKGPRRVLTFVPAHAWAYGSMDKTYGHHRRYSTRQLELLCRQVAPDAKITLRHFNALGLAGWFWNGRVLKKKQIDRSSLAIFEALVRYISRFDDFLQKKLHFPLGQSLLAVIQWD